MDLSFMKNVEVKEVAAKAKVSRITLEKTPVDGADFRVYKNGRMFCHPDTAKKYDLEFGSKKIIIIKGKDGEEDTTKEATSGNALDIFSSADFTMVDLEQVVIFVGITPREGAKKLDMYGYTSYNEDGSPKRSVDANSASSFGTNSLVPMLEEIYAVDFEDKDFVDLVMVTEYQIKSPNSIYAIPKVSSRGDNKGTPMLEARKDILVYPLTVFELPVEKKGKQVDIEDAIENAESKS